MKVMILSMVVLISLIVSAGGQVGAELGQVTLYSVQGHNQDFSRSSVNFETGERGPLGKTSDGFDLQYGIMSTKPSGGEWFRDWLSVCDPRSILFDLGEKKWADVDEKSSFPKDRLWRKPLPLNTPMAVDASAGKTADALDATKAMSPYRQFIMAKVGHLYLMRVVRGKSETYVMFRVESLTPGDNCLLSWKKVTPPEDDVEK